MRSYENKLRDFNQRQRQYRHANHNRTPMSLSQAVAAAAKVKTPTTDQKETKVTFTRDTKPPTSKGLEDKTDRIRTAKASYITATPRRAYANMARVTNRTRQRQAPTRRPGVHPIPFGPSVVLDSGASHHMHYNLEDLTNIEPILSQVMLPDGSVIDSNESGLLRVQMHCSKTGTPVVIPLLDCLHVPGLNATLWSVTAFVSSGHGVYFEPESIRVILRGSDNSVTTVHVSHIRDPDSGVIFHASYYAQRVHRRRAYAAMMSAIVTRPHQRQQPKKKVLLDLMHHRLGHLGAKSILAAD